MSTSGRARRNQSHSLARPGGAPTVLAHGGFTAEATWAVLEKLGVTDYAAAGLTVYRSLLAANHLRPAKFLTSCAAFSSAGEPLTPEVNEWASTALGLPVHDHFGRTGLGRPIEFPHHPDLKVPVVAGAMGVALPGWTMTVLATTHPPRWARPADSPSSSGKAR